MGEGNLVEKAFFILSLINVTFLLFRQCRIALTVLKILFYIRIFCTAYTLFHIPETITICCQVKGLSLPSSGKAYLVLVKKIIRDFLL